MKLLYNFFIQLYAFVASVISIYNSKAKKWVDGRKNVLQEIENKLQGNTSKIVWIHCASLGEFEQGRPVMEKLKSQSADIKIFLTFFSPSGYEVQKNYAGADFIFYLPIDTVKNAKLFLSIVNPSLIIYIKYEFWYHYLINAKERNIPVILVSGTFRSSQPFFKWYGKLHREMLGCFTHLFVQNDASYNLLRNIGFDAKTVVSGDTRFDRVLKLLNDKEHFEIIEKFIGNSKVIVAGSTWTEDDEELDHYANTHPEIKFIIAPHEINKDRLNECLSLYKHAVLYSKIETAKTDCNVLIIDNIGMLSKLYKYATICLVGGGFGGDGVHNVLEAAVYKKPVIFGPVYNKFIEAIELENAKGAFSVEDALELESTLNDLLTDKKLYQQACENAGNYVQSKAGATQKIVDLIYANRLLTN
ncbi:MAG: 3-deoxy-D-manno-octulosonic acid transferase [Chitinophagaceae bacterium]